MYTGEVSDSDFRARRVCNWKWEKIGQRLADFGGKVTEKRVSFLFLVYINTVLLWKSERKNKWVQFTILLWHKYNFSLSIFFLFLLLFCGSQINKCEITHLSNEYNFHCLKCCILGINILSHAILDQGDDKATASLNDKSEYYLLIYYSLE